MIKAIDKSNYQETLEVVYYISKNLLFNYPIDSLRYMINSSGYRDIINKTVHEIESTEGKKIDDLSKENRERYLNYLNKILLNKTREFVSIDNDRSKTLFKKINKTLSE